MGSNRDLVYGFVRGGSVWLTVVNLLQIQLRGEEKACCVLCYILCEFNDLRNLYIILVDCVRNIEYIFVSKIFQGVFNIIFLLVNSLDN